MGGAASNPRTGIDGAPYPKVISGDDLDGYLAEARELAGCITAAETSERLRDAMEGSVESALLAGEEIPAPVAGLSA